MKTIRNVTMLPDYKTFDKDPLEEENDRKTQLVILWVISFIIIVLTIMVMCVPPYDNSINGWLIITLGLIGKLVFVTGMTLIILFGENQNGWRILAIGIIILSVTLCWSVGWTVKECGFLKEEYVNCLERIAHARGFYVIVCDIVFCIIVIGFIFGSLVAGIVCFKR